jgi:hypothetical protein
MTAITRSLTEANGVRGLYGVADMGVEEGECQADSTIWDTDYPGPGEWIGVGDNGLTLRSGDNTIAYIRYELWDASPSIDPSWERSWAGSVFFSSGRITAVSFYSATIEWSYHTPFDLGRHRTDWQTRVAAKKLTGEHEPGFPPIWHQATLFKLQFWPPA